MTDRYLCALSTPAATFEDSFLVGNGTLGASIRGKVGTERLDLNIDTLWSGGPQPLPAKPDPAILPALRQAITDRNDLRADLLAQQLQGDAYSQSYQPLGCLEWAYAPGASAAGYERVLDLRNAQVKTTHGSGPDRTTVTTLVSAPDQVLLSSLRSLPTPIGTESRLQFFSPHPDVTTREVSDEYGEWLLVTGRVPAQVLPDYLPISDDEAISYADDTPTADGTVAAGMGFAVVALLNDDQSDPRLLVAAQSGFRGADARPSADLDALANQARQRVLHAATCSTAELVDRHRTEYRSWFDQIDLDLSSSPAYAGSHNPARAELLFHLGRYLLISSSRPGTQAANLQGIWNIDVRPGWSSNYTTNINTEMNYWAAEVTGLGELQQPLFDLVQTLTRTGADTARHYYRARGAAAHHNTDLWGFSAPVPGNPQFANWPSALPWLAAHLWDHQQFTPDPTFVDQRLRPTLRPISEFLLDSLVTNDESDHEVSPSTSPEHQFMGAEGAWTAVTQGCTMDQELVRELLSRYITISDPNDPLRAEATAALPRLRLPRLGSNGALLEWRDERRPRELGHRHLSHLYGLFPGDRITETAAPAEFEGVRRALHQRLDNGGGHTGWSQAWVLCLAARLRERNLADESIAILLDHLTSVSLLALHPHPNWPDGKIFQIDGNLGAPGGIAECLVQSHERVEADPAGSARMITLLPALPLSWPIGTARGLRLRGGGHVDFDWVDGRLKHATVTRTLAEPMVLDLPAGPGTVAVTADTRKVTATPQDAPGRPARRRLTLPSEAGTYSVTIN